MPIYKDYNNHEINDIIDDALEIGWFKSNKSFQSIFKKWGLTEEELIIIMSDQLDTKSFKQWEKGLKEENITLLIYMRINEVYCNESILNCTWI